ncbi:hypothetical protein C5Y96_08785 [Blastopirellula marina]|uniref:DUF6677 domain-containing protein n=1 Tax=Blastopirellula marina TaxID=124 RepID=A0A2S8FUK6_9BACT|nr:MULTISPECIES: DUF6677 family protein [Pirellulaceae]PQO35740.1 hypothetical protein C5Y96_08785 [Blastopirellula marina]RCS53314.1 hypothetical protein DTL36_08795 [Bremerella cremea]
MSNDAGSASPAADQDPFAPIPVDLKNPTTAIFLAWLIPGAGHLYQGRRGKGILFLVCILSIYFLGLSMGGGRVVYAKWDNEEKRLPLICQLGVGLPTLPALAQSLLVRQKMDPIEIAGVRFMAPPIDGEMAELHRTYGYLFEMGTLYTMIAGLLNVLVIYDAGAGPVWMVPDSERKKRAKDEDEDDKSEPGVKKSESKESSASA